MSDIVRTLIGIGILVFCVCLFIFTYLLNKKTPKPEGCMENDEACAECQILSCTHKNKKEG